MSEHLLITVDTERYAVPIAQVQVVVACGPITPVPGAPASLRGLANIGGQLVPVLAIGRNGARPSATSVLAFLGHAQQRCALLADSTSGIGAAETATLLDINTVMRELDHA